MSLATRCTACGTVFRVVQDQLKVSEGWVRCGRCGEVFNALEGLFDLEGTSGPTPLAREPGDSVPTALTSASQPHAPDRPEDDAPTTQLDTRAPSSSFEASDPAVEDEHEHSTRDARSLYDLLDSEVPDDMLLAEPAAPTPQFLRDEQAAAAWQRPRVQRSLEVLAALLALVLVLQVVVTQRDTLAARWPAAAPWLEALCIGCSIEPPRDLEALAVDSSGLARVEGSLAYRLQVALRNGGALPVAMPAFDLTLTDLRGDVVARRVLYAGELAGSAAPAAIAGGGAWSVNALIEVGDARIAGYTVELFYP